MQVTGQLPRGDSALCYDKYDLLWGDNSYVQEIIVTTLKPLSVTRWESKIDSLKPIRYQIKEIYNALIQLSKTTQGDIQTRHEAECLANKLTDYKFLISIVVWYDILFQINIVSKSLKSITMDVVTATSLIKSCVEYISKYRTSGYNDALMKANELEDILGIEKKFNDLSRSRKRKRQFDYESQHEEESDPENIFKREFFYSLLDTALVVIEDRFE